MTERLQIYKCEICGNIVQVLYAGKGQLVCCGKPMKLIEEKTIDVGKEKHVPVVEQKNDTVVVKVGEAPHPMEQQHYIEWIELIADKRSLKAFLSPGDKPEATFTVKAEKIYARAYCNLHGLWKSA